MAAIQLIKVTKTFRPEPTTLSRAALRLPQEQPQEIRALDRLDLYVPDGQTIAVVGPSGCGKSTLLRVVAGLTDYEGVVMYDGRDMRNVPSKERRIGMVFQNYALYPHFYGRGNLRFFFLVNRAPDAEAEARIRLTAEIMGFGFKELLKRKPGTLSGGQQQRLAIGRAIVRQPELFLLDEPLSNLDAKLRVQTRLEIKRLLHKFAITTLYVTHDQVEAQALGDTIAVMHAGRIEQVGTYQDIIAHPANLFVAGFLGLPPMNLIPAEVIKGHLVLRTGQRIPLPGQIAEVLHRTDSVTLGIRPDAIRLAPLEGVREVSQGFDLRGTIDVVEPDFARRTQIVYASHGEVSFCVQVTADQPMAQGYPIRVLIPWTAVHWFDTASGSRLV